MTNCPKQTDYECAECDRTSKWTTTWVLTVGGVFVGAAIGEMFSSTAELIGLFSGGLLGGWCGRRVV